MLKKNRGKGYALCIMNYLTYKVLESGMVPFGNIETHNIASLKMTVKCGYLEDRMIHWVYLK